MSDRGSSARSTPAPWRWALLVLALLVAARHVISDWRLASSLDVGVDGDISVYIGAINYLASGGALYDYPLSGGYGFTYPPFAAIVLRPLIWLSPLTTGLIWMTACLLVAVVLVSLVVSTRTWPATTVGKLTVWGLAVGAFLGSAQVQSDLITGQVNLVLALLVVLDVGRFVPERFRGVGVGIAAAIKLTPLVIWGWFVVTRQWRALGSSVGTFAACVALAWAVLPRDSMRFWTSAVLDVSRVGDVELRFNASVMGMLARAGLDSPIRSLLWLAIGGIFVLSAYRRAEQARQHGDHVAAAVVLGCAAVIATPIAWPHHQIWLPLAGIVLATRTAWTPRMAGLAVLVFTYLHITLTMWWDAHDLGWLFNDGLFYMFAAICLFGLSPRADGAMADEPVSKSGRLS